MLSMSIETDAEEMLSKIKSEQAHIRNLINIAMKSENELRQEQEILNGLENAVLDLIYS